MFMKDFKRYFHSILLPYSMKRTLSIIAIILFSVVNAQIDITNPKIKWKFKTDGPIRGTSKVADDKLYFGSTDGYLYALNKFDGNLLWKFQTPGAISATPALSENTVYIASRDNFLYAIESVSGKLKWKFQMQPDLPENYAGWKYFTSSPEISNNKVLIGWGDGNLYALNKEDGELIWKYSTKGVIRAAPLVSDGKVYQPSNDGILYVLDEDEGKLLWKFHTEGAHLDERSFRFDRNSIYTKPVIHQNTLIIGSRDGNTYAIDIKNKNKNKKWNFTYGSTWAMSCAVDDERVYVGWSTNNHISALNLKSGKETWKLITGAHNFTTPFLDGENLYLGSANGKMYQINKTSGEINWEYEIGSEIHSSPVFSSGNLFFGSDDGYFYALEEEIRTYKAVYEPKVIEGIAKYTVADKRLTPYLIERGFEQLETDQLYQFIVDRINDKAPSVIVFSFPIVPKHIMGSDPSKGLLRNYLETGGKILWFGEAPNYYEINDSGDFTRDPADGEKLLGVTYVDLSESGNYYSKTTQDGMNWGLPAWFKTTGIPLKAEGIIPLAYDEFNRVSAWVKKFNPRAGSGYVSFRSWSWNVSMKEQDFDMIYKLATYQLE